MRTLYVIGFVMMYPVVLAYYGHEMLSNVKKMAYFPCLATVGTFFIMSVCWLIEKLFCS